MNLCECGCGTPTVQAKRTQRGYQRGQFQRYAVGHKQRETGYRQVRRGDEFYTVHRMRAENALGKPLPIGAIVHHADGSTHADAPLVICQDQAYHQLLHLRMRIQARGGNPNTDRICGYCHAVKPIHAFSVSKKRLSGVHGGCKACNAARTRVWQADKNTKMAQLGAGV